MKRSITFTLLAMLLCVAAAFGQKTSGRFSEPGKVTITGKAHNMQPGTTDLEVIIFRLGLSQDMMLIPVDAEGNFRIELETYAPLTVNIRMRGKSLSLLAFPGDVMHAEFDARTPDPQLRITGDRAKTNVDFEAFSQMWLRHPSLMDFNTIFGGMKNDTPEQYLAFMDRYIADANALYDQFVATHSPNEETKLLARTMVDLRYPDFLGLYIADWKNNVHYGKMEMPADFAERMVVPLTENMIISTYVKTYTNRMHIHYSRSKANEYFLSNQIGHRTPNGGIFYAKSDAPLYLSKMVEFTPGPLLKQLVLMESMVHRIDQGDLSEYEDNLELVDRTITLPYLRKPLHELYLSTKMRMENPVLHSEAVLKQMEGSSVGEIMKTILEENKGKVIYVDVWATWCGPCKDEMPHSNKLHHELEGRDVAFVYLCIDSNESTWKANLDEMKLAGTQYFFTETQSNELRSLFNITGIPHYMIIDREGTILPKSDLRPSDPATRKKIQELLAR